MEWNGDFQGRARLSPFDAIGRICSETAAQPRKPRSRAKTIAWARVQTPSLSKRFETWLRTVFSLRPRRSAMSALLSPSVRRARIPRSRAVSDREGSFVGPRRVLDSHEVADGVAESLPGRLALEQDVVLRVQLDELGAGDARRELPPRRDRHGRVFTGVEDERRRAHLLDELRDVHRAARPQQIRGDRRRARPPAELVEPVHLLARRARNEARGEDLPEGRVVPPPPDGGELDDRLVLALPDRVAAERPAPRVAAVQHEPRDALGMLHRVRDGNATRPARCRRAGRRPAGAPRRRRPRGRRPSGGRRSPRRSSRSSRSRVRRSARSGSGR